MEDEHIRFSDKQRKLEAVTNAGLWTACDEEFDLGDLRYKLPKDGEDCRRGFVVFALVQRVDHDHCRNGGFNKGLYNQPVHLAIQGLVGDFWIGPHEWDEDGSKFGICACELNGDGGKDQLEVAPVLEVSGTEKGGAEPSVCECSLRDCLRYGAFSRPCESIQPVDRGLVKVACLKLDLVQNCSLASPLEATVTIAMPVLGLFCASETVDDGCFNCGKSLRTALIKHDRTENELTWVLSRKVISSVRHTRGPGLTIHLKP